MKLDTSHMRYLTSEDFKVLQAVEQGTRNHELVPTTLIHTLGGLRSPTGTNRCIGDLAKLKLISRLRNAKYDGYRLTFSGYDYLALKSMLNRGTLYAVGSIIGVGKESDIYSIGDPEGQQKVLKIHRLGRTSFRTVKNNRDYLQHRNTSNWMYLSKLAAQKEYEFMVTLYNNGFIVPEPFDYSRHCVMMEWIKGVPMKHLKKHKNIHKLYLDLMNFIVKLGNHGLIHCDFNEFNIIIRDEDQLEGREFDFVVIDFPQCVSIDHTDAAEYFKRDVQGVRDFFAKKFRYTPESDSTMLDTDGYGEGYRYAYPKFERDVVRCASLDVEVKASGYAKKTTGRKEDKDLEKAVLRMRDHEEDSEGESNDENEDEDEDEDEDEEESEEYENFSEDLEDTRDDTLENEKIIEALSSGVQELEMDKLGNYIVPK